MSDDMLLDEPKMLKIKKSETLANPMELSRTTVHFLDSQNLLLACATLYHAQIIEVVLKRETHLCSSFTGQFLSIVSFVLRLFGWASGHSKCWGILEHWLKDELVFYRRGLHILR